MARGWLALWGRLMVGRRRYLEVRCLTIRLLTKRMIVGSLGSGRSWPSGGLGCDG